MADKILANELKSRKGEFLIIDVREADELAGGKIEDSIHMPLGLVIRKAKKGGIEDLKDKKICTYCASGYRGNIAADELNKAGFTAITLDRGFPSWSQT
ncbi:MAG: rhodanese-like domain-containing protein [Nitrosopumilaceae archaeon]|nr:MAG: FAD-dependent pyridine nucleotide-disulfide oxidoreductase [Marine Group I thaumarchaeote]